MAEQERLFKVVFMNQGSVYELFVRKVYQADMFGFIVLEEFVFGERSSVVVDPSEERLKDEFASVKRSFIPLQAVLRIDEVAQRGNAKISEIGDKVTPFPVSFQPPKA